MSKVQITIRGRRYTVRSDDEDVDIQAVAAFVDARMTEIGSRSSTFDEYTIAMLAALNIASEYERLRRSVDAELADIDREIAATSVLVEAAIPREKGA